MAADRPGDESFGYGSSDRGYDYRGGAQQSRQGGSDWKIGERVAHVAESARDYASDVTGKVSETASSYASSVSSYADEARRAISEQSGRLGRQAHSTMQDTISRVLQEQPLMVALAGVAAGAAIAAVFPVSNLEQRTLGPAGERLAELAWQNEHHTAPATGRRLASSGGCTRTGPLSRIDSV